MHTWVCGIFGVNFELKKALCTSCLVLAFWSHGPTGIKIGSVWICFPVWRELKRPRIFRSTPGRWQVWICFPVWRELKQSDPTPRWHFKIVWICFPVWRELKQKRDMFVPPKDQPLFGYAFPFEGNWNRYRVVFAYTLSYNVWICFPVWRELKPFTSSNCFEVNSVVWICFPVWRELKLFPRWDRRSRIARLDMLSRLKGIETTPCLDGKGDRTCLDMLSRLKGIGEWLSALGFQQRGVFCLGVSPGFSKTSCYWWLMADCWWLTPLRFPVWRELKHISFDAFDMMIGSLDTLSRLKGIEEWLSAVGFQQSEKKVSVECCSADCWRLMADG